MISFQTLSYSMQEAWYISAKHPAQSTRILEHVQLCDGQKCTFCGRLVRLNAHLCIHVAPVPVLNRIRDAAVAKTIKSEMYHWERT